MSKYVFESDKKVKFLDNIGFNKFREVSFLQKVGNKQDNPTKQQNNQSNLFKTQEKDTFEPSFTSLNDLDSNIINNNLVNLLPDAPLRLELQIGMQEQRLKDVKTEMKVMSFLGYDEESREQASLRQKEQQAAEKIAGLRKEYRDLGLPYKVIDTFSDLVQKSKNKASEAKILFTGHPLVKGIKGLFPSLKVNEEINQTLDVSTSFQNNIFSKFSSSPVTFGKNSQSHIAGFIAIEKLNNKIKNLLKLKEQGLKIRSFFKNTYDKTVSGIKDSIGGLKPIISTKKAEPDNFFEAKNLTDSNVQNNSAL